MKTYPLVTIAIPTYNRADGYLRQTLESALNQTYPNLDILVSDNCSVDDTAKLVTSFPDPRIRYIKHQVNVGQTNNFNFCLREAKGDYFLLLPDDDLIDHDFVETCIEAAERPPETGDR
jgi:glycosyltransferase involved in cell wall biosynthesis